MQVIKRDGSKQEYNFEKIKKALNAAFMSTHEYEVPEKVLIYVKFLVEHIGSEPTVEDIQDKIIEGLHVMGYPQVEKSYILYRAEHENARFIKERIDYMDQYVNSGSNAATSSETDANANVTQKNVANLESEVYKTTNRIIQRKRMKDKLNELYPEVAKQYEKDLNHHIIYTHDEASTPVLKQYCMAVSLFPLMTEGVGNIDGVTPGPPNDLLSFSGQITNLAFLLSSQCKGAVAFGEYFIALNYYVRMEYGNDWFVKLDHPITSMWCKIPRTIYDGIIKAFKHFVWGVNQPAQNRAYQSPSK